VSLKRIYIGGTAAADDDNNDYIMMTLRERLWATKLLTSESNSKEDHPRIIQYFCGIFNA